MKKKEKTKTNTEVKQKDKKNLKENKKKDKLSKEENVTKKSKLILIISAILIVILIILLVISKTFGDFSVVRLKVNDEDIFSISDLTVNELKYGDSYSDVIKVMGEADKEDTDIENSYVYKILSYDGITFTLKENYSEYMLVKVEITDKQYEIARGINVGDSVTSVINSFKVENKKGTYIYGNYSADALSEEEITSNIYMGLRNSTQLIYVNRDTIVNNLPTNIAKLEMEYKYGKITKIIWSYDIE